MAKQDGTGRGWAGALWKQLHICMLQARSGHGYTPRPSQAGSSGEPGLRVRGTFLPRLLPALLRGDQSGQEAPEGGCSSHRATTPELP